MRTTVTLDDDVVEAIDKELRRRRKSSFKEVINDLIRAGCHSRREVKRVPRFVVRARHMGLRRGLNYDDVGGLLEKLEGETHR
jgi:hypothetical protein